MDIISKLLNTPFRAKKGTSAYFTFKKESIYITQVDERGQMALSNLSPKQRENEDYADENEIGSAWHDESELIL